ncbi:hypothetical protein [Pseudarthrobacter sp. BIM B-2242]|uniref:hypothetical protein n=1 Tax=Pseudarthrobacter sp. BIM B-2242 TaxID=2772401 RepID=UPI00168BE9F5|nr:hypothetical protein [Pseudarthrobacter sp. BIM B-2242]QOD06116.1 hypothetical protein IDT60_21385 [Pseudarthrobacter sp. BIM B-2242]
MVTQARVKPGVPAGGEFTAVGHSDAVPALTPPLANPATVFAGAVGTAKDPTTIPWPERPDNSRVEVFVSDDDLNDVLRHCGYEGDEADAYSQVYASIDLIGDKDCDFYGITRDGKEEIIALGITDYEQAVEPFDHENLRYRDGFTNPMPEFLAARAVTQAKQLAAAKELLDEAGVTVELEDLRRGYYRLRRDGTTDLQFRTESYPHRVIETTNWRQAGDEHLEAFLGGEAGVEGQQLLSRCATIVAQDMHREAYKMLAEHRKESRELSGR